MSGRSHCEVHRLACGPDGLCVLCRRGQLSDPPPPPALSPATAVRVGFVVTLAGIGGMGLIAATVFWVLGQSQGGDIAFIEAETATAAADAEAAARKAELARIAKSDIWKQPSAPVVPTTGTAAEVLEITPVTAAIPSQQPTAAELAAQAQAASEEAERDRVRHAQVAADLEHRAQEHARRQQAAAIAEARAKLRIDMYSADWCGNCRKAIDYLREQTGLSYSVHDIDREPSARDKMRKLNPRHSVPTFKIDDDVVVGFSASSLERAIETAARKRAGLPL